MQADVLDAIRKLTREKGYPPTVRELCDAVGLRSTSTVHFHLHALKQAGKVDFDPNKSRTVRLVK